MKKMQLTIHEPCHENWENMSQEDQGRFCSACKKTVVDFTGMSDRQVIAFFKKPAGSVCGRFYQDQLNRDLLPPPKRLSWIRYFFQFTLPLFMMALKSCGFKEKKTLGEIKMEVTSNLILPEMQPTIGIIVPQIVNENQEIDSLPILSKPISNQVYLKGDTTVTEGEIKTSETTVANVNRIDMDLVKVNASDEIQESQIPLDTVFAIAYPATKHTIIMGGITSVTKCSQNTSNEDAFSITNNAQTPAHACTIYPNPARPGSVVNIRFDLHDKLPHRLQLISASGQLEGSMETGSEMTNILAFPISTSVKPGLYFLQMWFAGAKAPVTEKIMVQ